MRNWIEFCNGDYSGLRNESERQIDQVPLTAVTQVLLVKERTVSEPARPDSLISQSESADGRISRVVFALFALVPVRNKQCKFQLHV